MYALSTNSPLERYPKGDAVLDLLTNPSGGHILPAHESGLAGAASSWATTSSRQIPNAFNKELNLASPTRCSLR